MQNILHSEVDVQSPYPNVPLSVLSSRIGGPFDYHYTKKCVCVCGVHSRYRRSTSVVVVVVTVGCLASSSCSMHRIAQVHDAAAARSIERKGARVLTQRDICSGPRVRICSICKSTSNAYDIKYIERWIRIIQHIRDIIGSAYRGDEHVHPPHTHTQTHSHTPKYKCMHTHSNSTNTTRRRHQHAAATIITYFMRERSSGEACAIQHVCVDCVYVCVCVALLHNTQHIHTPGIHHAQMP